MKPVKLICGCAKEIIYDPAYDYIGVDKGAWIAMVHHIPLVHAIGDFDSIEPSQFEKLKEYCPLTVLPTRKNETDSEAAMQLAKSLGYEKMVLYGAIGGRFDHTLANLYMMLYRDDDVILENETHLIWKCTAGTYRMKKRFQYLSFFALESSIISIHGVQYPLEHHKITKKDILTISNEIIEEACLEIIEGSLIVIQCEDE